MFLFFLLICLGTSSGLLLSTDDRVSSRNITCLNGTSSSILFNCEACLITSRNNDIRTSLSLTGSGPSGISYQCLRVDQIEAYHENLVRECQNFPRNTLNGYDDFCVASSFSRSLGSYRACMCVSNACNFNYSECVQHGNPYWDPKPPSFRNTIVPLANRVKCYRPYEDYNQPTYTNLLPLCSSNNEACKNFVFDNGVLCAIVVDRTNNVIRQTLPPSVYSSYLIKYKTMLCRSFTWTSKSIYFTRCLQGETVCMCTTDACDQDLETCQASTGTKISYYSFSYFLLLVFNIYLMK